MRHDHQLHFVRSPTNDDDGNAFSRRPIFSLSESAQIGSKH